METVRLIARLLAFTRPYRTRLVIGILAGMLSGGSLFGVLYWSPNLIRPFEEPANDASDTETAAPDTAAVAPAIGPATEELPAEVPDAIRRLADRLNLTLVKPDGTVTWVLVLLSMVGLPLFFMAKCLFSYVNRYFLQWVGARVVMDLRNALFAHLQQQSLGFFGRSDVGQLISRCTNDTVTVERSISGTVADLCRAPFEVGAAAAFVIYYSYVNDILLLPIGLLCVVPLCILPIIIMGRRVKVFSKQALSRISTLVSRMHENFTGIRVVKAFFTEAAESERFRTMNRGYFRQVIKAMRAELLMTPLMQMVAAVCACVFLVVCYARDIRLSQIIPMGGAAFFCYGPIKQLAKINAQLQRMTAAAERIFDLLDTDTALPESPAAVAVDSLAREIVFDDVSFAYDRDSPTTVDHVSFSLPKGHVVALVGETGSGKTTIANLLARFYDPTAGSVSLDGTDLRDVKLAALRHLIGVVTQETILFNDTIAHNIRYGSEWASHDDVVRAAQQANAHEFILEEPEGYDRVIGEKGFRLSGGQRQRLAIARAILRNPQILILDEATSALDTVTEQLVQTALNNLMQHRTVLAIAHRLSTIRHAHKILVIDKGRIVEQGTHEELLAGHGRYQRLCEMQFN